MSQGSEHPGHRGWQAISSPAGSVLVNIRRKVLSPVVRLWQANFHTVPLLPMQQILRQKALKDAGLQSAGEQRQAEFWAGRSLMMQAFNQRSPCRIAASGAPLFPPGRHGALSHSGNAVLLLEGPERLRLGADMEPPLSAVAVQSVFSRVATTAEQQWLRNLPAGQLPLAATLLFSAKETLFKLLSREMTLRPDYALVEACTAPGADSMRFVLTRQAGPGLAAGDEFCLHYEWMNTLILTWAIDAVSAE